MLHQAAAMRTLRKKALKLLRDTDAHPRRGQALIARPFKPASISAPEGLWALSAPGSGGADFAATLTELLRDVALALDENEPFLREAFGPQAVLEAAAGLQRACDEEGTRVLQRFVQLRRLPQLVKEVGLLSAARRSADSSAAVAPPVDPRQAHAFHFY